MTETYTCTSIPHIYSINNFLIYDRSILYDTLIGKIVSLI